MLRSWVGADWNETSLSEEERNLTVGGGTENILGPLLFIFSFSLYSLIFPVLFARMDNPEIWEEPQERRIKLFS